MIIIGVTSIRPMTDGQLKKWLTDIIIIDNDDNYY